MRLRKEGDLLMIKGLINNKLTGEGAITSYNTDHYNLLNRKTNYEIASF